MLRKIENGKRALAALCGCILRCHKKLMPASAFSFALNSLHLRLAISPINSLKWYKAKPRNSGAFFMTQNQFS